MNFSLVWFTAKTADCGPVRQLALTGAHLHVKHDIWKYFDPSSEVITWLTFGAIKTLPNIEEKPNRKLVPLEDFSGLLLQHLILH